MVYQCTTTACLPTHLLGWHGSEGRSAQIRPWQAIPYERISRAGRTRKTFDDQLRLGQSRLILAPVSKFGISPNGRGLCRERSVAVAAAVASQQQEKEKEIVRLDVSVDHISSPSNAYVKHLVRLRQSPKTRSATESILVLGTIPLREICESVREMVDRKGVDRKRNPLVDVLLVRKDTQKTPGELVRVSRRIVHVSSEAMSKLSGLDSPPEVAGVLPFPSSFMTFQPFRNATSSGEQMMKWCSSPRRILVLDSIQDPGNMGTLLRTAAAFGWDGVFLLHGCCDPFNDKALRASRGASFRVPIGIGEWDHVREFASANQLKLYAGDPEPGEGSAARSYSPSDKDEQFKLPIEDNQQGLCLVLGSEGQGLSDHVTKDCFSIGIPMPGDSTLFASPYFGETKEHDTCPTASERRGSQIAQSSLQDCQPGRETRSFALHPFECLPFGSEVRKLDLTPFEVGFCQVECWSVGSDSKDGMRTPWREMRFHDPVSYRDDIGRFLKRKGR